jgi:hypothetical protein
VARAVSSLSTGFGLDVLVVWDPDDSSTDLYVALGHSVAGAIGMATKRVGARIAADVERIDRALLEIARNIEARGPSATSATRSSVGCGSPGRPLTASSSF